MLSSAMTRRAMLGGGGALLAAPRLGAQPAARPPAAALRVDSLCYTSNVSAESVGQVLAGGMNAAVLDIQLYPRERDGAIRELGNWLDRFAEPALRLLPVLSAADFGRAAAEERLGIVLACQDATILGSALGDFQTVLRLLHRLGLRVLQLTHNSRTHFADSYFEERDGGLSRGGAQLVRAMNGLGMIVDLSHCSTQTLLDTLALSEKPCAITHAGCRALAPTRRNKTDAEIRAIGERGGYFGIFGLSTWLTSAPEATIGTLLDHVDHAVQLIGPDKVGFGSDGDLAATNAEAELQGMSGVQQRNAGGPSAEWPVRHVRIPELNGPDRMRRLADALSGRGYSDAQVNGIAGGNFIRLFEAVCG